MTAHVLFEVDDQLVGVPIDDVDRFEGDADGFLLCFVDGRRWRLRQAPTVKDVGAVRPLPGLLSGWAEREGLSGVFRHDQRLGFAVAAAWEPPEPDTDEVAR